MEGNMKRRDFLKGGAGLIAAAASTPAVAQDASPRVLELIRINWCYGQPRLRQNIYTLYNSNPNHPTILAYRNAVALMKTRPASDPTSWLYQANIHGTNTPNGSWPASAPWSTCEHGYHFLSWHRMYLYFFERIVRAASGDPNFALPYWDYGGPLAHRTLPPPFRTPNNNTNALWDGTRAAVFNNPTTPSPLPASAVNSTSCLTPLTFTGHQNSVNGTPHGVVHTTLGGNMGGFNTAGQDPIFWLHHCNIDRLWEKWRAQGGGRVNPVSDPTWMNTNFTFADENKNLVQMSGDDIVNTINQLHYQYEDPRTCIPPWWYYLVASANFTLASARSRVLASLVLARNVKPTPDQARIDLRTDDGDTRERLAKILSFDLISKTIESGARYSLVFEGVQTDAQFDGYFEVYLGLPRDGKLDSDGPNYVGNLSLFGADAESRRSAKGGHAGHTDFGQQTSLDVTEPLKRLVERGDIKNELLVTLVPMGGAKSPNDRFVFDAKANPRIESIVLTIEKDE
jgi:Common central domain of tyrosinase/Polyphenol oxidase middle domain/TAT (twin-arginine translocation) pathway signal sequence